MKLNSSIHLDNGENPRSRQLYRIEEDETNENAIPTDQNIGTV